MSEIYLHPNGAGIRTQWNYPLFNPHWGQVDEDPHDGDTTHVADDGVFVPNGIGPKDFYSLESSGLGSVAIQKVEVLFVGKITAYTGKISPGLYLNGIYSYGTARTMTLTWTEYAEEVARPGGGLWTIADLIDLQVGVVASGGSTSCKTGSCIRCTQVRVKITYSENLAEIELDGSVAFDYPTILYLSSESSDLGNGDGDYRFDKAFHEDTSSQSDKSIIVGYIYGSPKTCYGFTASQVPNNAIWESGKIAVCLSLSAHSGAFAASLRVSVSRVNSVGIVQESSDWSDPVTLPATSAAKIYGFMLPYTEWSTGSTGDRIRVNYEFTASDGGWGAEVLFNDGNSKIGTSVIWHRIAEIEIDGHITVTKVNVIDSDGHIVKIASVGIDANGHIVKTDSDEIGLDGHMLAVLQTAIYLNGYVGVPTYYAAIDLDGCVIKTTLAIIDLDGHVYRSLQEAIEINGSIMKTDSGQIEIDGHIYASLQDAINANGWIVVTHTAFIDINGHIAATYSAAVGFDGCIYVMKTADISLDGTIILTRSATKQLIGHVMTQESAIIMLAGFIRAMTAQSLITISGEVTDRGIGKLVGKGWYHKIGECERTEFWLKR